MIWSEAYFLQARSEKPLRPSASLRDWQVYQTIQRQPVPECHSLHYLQMAAEKMGKAFLIAGGNAPASVHTSHRAFVRFLQVVAHNPDLQKQ